MAVTIPEGERFFIIGILSGRFGGARILRVPGRGAVLVPVPNSRLVCVRPDLP